MAGAGHCAFTDHHLADEILLLGIALVAYDLMFYFDWALVRRLGLLLRCLRHDCSCVLGIWYMVMFRLRMFQEVLERTIRQDRKYGIGRVA